jgi:hypothetical protein
LGVAVAPGDGADECSVDGHAEELLAAGAEIIDLLPEWRDAVRTDELGLDPVRDLL